MIRALFGAQFAFFLSFGAMAGLCFSFYLNSAVAQARESGQIDIIIDMPLTTLAELDIRT